MKQLLWGSALAALIAACGGGSKPPTEPQPQPKSACAVAAENVAGVVIGAKIDNFTEEHRPAMVKVLTERCEGDAWSTDAVACLSKMTSAETDLQRCGGMLTDTQEDAVEVQMNREVLKRGEENEKSSSDGDMEGGSGAKPPPAPPPDDPCGGGA